MTSESAKDQLPEIDREFLDKKGFDYEVTKVGGELHLVIRDFDFPAYAPSKANLLIIIPAGYPNAQLDMFWTNPDVKLPNGAWPAQCQHHQEHSGKSWQRWSRHFQQAWRSGIDGLRTFMASIRAEISKGI